MKPNRTFELSVQDIEIIETALSAKIDRRTRKAIVDDSIDKEKLLDEANVIRDLLGRIHNQKAWYRPKDGTYVGG